MLSQFFTIPTVLAIIIFILGFILILEPENLSQNSIENRMMRSQFKSSKHKWQKSQLKSFYFCYLCHKLITSWFSGDVLECKKCGIVIHKICKYLKLRKPECKYIIAKNISNREDQKFYHQWRQCSYNSSTNCSICDGLCVGFQTYICIWCHRTKHGSCDGNNIQCDFGSLRKFIVEPTEVRCSNVVTFTIKAFTSLRKNRKRIKERTSEDSENIHNVEDDIQFKLKDKSKHPVIVIINKKSGGQTGNEFIKAFYQSLNPLQVISILDEGLEKLKIFKSIPNVFFLIAGGDGTICSVLNYIKTIPGWEKNNPPTAILPLGTGNDLSRSLGWGSSADEINPEAFLPEMFKNGKMELLDRWRLTIARGQEEKQMTLYNYLGVGLDARICKDFHDIREKYPKLFFSQFSNKLIYTQMGAVDLFKASKSNQPLSKLVEMRIDGKLIPLEDIENIILLNIRHWGGGVTGLWDQNNEFQKQSYSDGLIEVIGLSDVIHMGQVQMGMDSPFQLGQGKQVQITSKLPKPALPIQIDGQPLEVEGPMTIRVCRKDQVNVLATHSSEQGKLLSILMQGVKNNIINDRQLEQLMDISKVEIERS